MNQTSPFVTHRSYPNIQLLRVDRPFTLEEYLTVEEITLDLGEFFSKDVSEIMSSPAIIVGLAASLNAVAGSMLDNRIGRDLVGDSGLEGIVPRSDVLRTLYNMAGTLTDLSASDAMSRDIVTVKSGAIVSEVRSMMEEHTIKKLPVVQDLNVVGVVTMTDIAQHRPTRVREVREPQDRRDEWTR